MNAFDSAVVPLINQYARQSDTFDSLVFFIADEPLLKGGILVVFLWVGWTYPYPDKIAKRQFVISTLYAVVAALLFAKILRYFLPFRLRPLHDGNLGFRLPYHVSSETLWNWSSFPSDTAAMLFALSAGLFFISRRIGIFAILYSFLFGCLPRIYLGYHYPTDIAAGAVIGILGAAIFSLPEIRTQLARLPLMWSKKYPVIFYPGLFLITCEIGSIFENTRRILTFITR